MVLTVDKKSEYNIEENLKPYIYGQKRKISKKKKNKSKKNSSSPNLVSLFFWDPYSIYLNSDDSSSDSSFDKEYFDSQQKTNSFNSFEIKQVDSVSQDNSRLSEKYHYQNYFKEQEKEQEEDEEEEYFEEEEQEDADYFYTQLALDDDDYLEWELDEEIEKEEDQFFSTKELNLFENEKKYEWNILRSKTGIFERPKKKNKKEKMKKKGTCKYIFLSSREYNRKIQNNIDLFPRKKIQPTSMKNENSIEIVPKVYYPSSSLQISTSINNNNNQNNNDLDLSRAIAASLQNENLENIENNFGISSDEARLLRILEQRDITPQDYELLLLLDNSVEKKTIDKNILEKQETIQYSNELLEEGDTCMVCLEEFNIGDKLKKLTVCGHFFHFECINQWLSKSSQLCPLCKKEVI